METTGGTLSAETFEDSNGEELPNFELQLTLELYGFTQPMQKTPPVFAGTLFRVAVRSLAGL